MKRPTSDAKALLREVLKQQLAQRPYVSVEVARAALAKAGGRVQPATLNRYLVEFTRAGQLFDAGRGWYSSLAQPLVLDSAPVQPLADALAKAFPLVAFSCWSTAQVQGAMHHLLGKFVSFVMVEAEDMETVSEHLRDAGWDAWLNPRGTEAARFAVRERTVVVRRDSRKSPSQSRLAPIEKILVDLWFEARDLQLMSPADFHAMLANLAGTRRISMATLIRYAANRKLLLAKLFGARNQLMPPIRIRRH